MLNHRCKLIPLAVYTVVWTLRCHSGCLEGVPPLVYSLGFDLTETRHIRKVKRLPCYVKDCANMAIVPTPMDTRLNCECIFL